MIRYEPFEYQTTVGLEYQMLENRIHSKTFPFKVKILNGKKQNGSYFVRFSNGPDHGSKPGRFI